MNFATDKDLRKAVPKRNPSARSRTKIKTAQANLITDNTTDANNSTCNNQDDLLERTRMEREQRSLQRDLAKNATKIQARWRSYQSRCNFLTQLMMDVSTKISDTKKLNSLFTQRGLPPIVVPPDIAFDLIQKLNLIAHFRYIDIIAIWTDFCRCIIIPVVYEIDPSKNIVCVEYRENRSFPTLIRFVKLMIELLCSYRLFARAAAGISNETLNSALSLAECLYLIVGGGVRYKMKFPAHLAEAFSALRACLFQLDILGYLRKVFRIHGDNLMNLTMSYDDLQYSNALVRNKFRESAAVFDVLFATSVLIIDVSATDESIRMDMIVYNLLSTPLLMEMLSDKCLKGLCLSIYFPSLLESLEDPGVVPLPSPSWNLIDDKNSIAPNRMYSKAEGRDNNNAAVGLIPCGQWVLGNLCALLPYAGVVIGNMKTLNSERSFVTPSIELPLYMEVGKEHETGEQFNYQMSDLHLELLLKVIGRWLNTFMIPDIYQGRSGIVWQSHGSNLIAVGVPTGLEHQMRLLLEESTILSLCKRIILPIQAPGCDVNFRSTREDCKVCETTQKIESSIWKDLAGLSSDVQDVKDSLASTGFAIANTALKQHQEESRWFSSKWAMKMTNSLRSTLGITSSAASVTTLKDVKITYQGDFSDMNGKYANARLVDALVSIWAQLLPLASSAATDSALWRALSRLAFSNENGMVPRLWKYAITGSVAPIFGKVTSDSQRELYGLHIKNFKLKGVASSIDLDQIVNSFDVNAFLQANDTGSKKQNSKQQSSNAVISLIFTIASVLRLQLIALDDSEMYDSEKPIPLHQILRLVRAMKMILYKSLNVDPTLLAESKNAPQSEGGSESVRSRTALQHDHSKVVLQHSLRAISSVLADLHSRWARRPFASSRLWEIEETGTRAILSEIKQKTPFGNMLIKTMPWSIDFHERMTLIRKVLDADRLQVQGSNDAFSIQPRSRGVVVRIRRALLLEDGMSAINKIGNSIKDRIQVRYINEFGEEEAGIDAGGLFKDFLVDLSDRVFDPSYGLFCITDSNLLYPNPAASILYDNHDLDSLYIFLGRVLGKALYENITLQPQFAHFFLAFMHGKYNFMNLLNDLSTLDAEIYKNLMFLKTYEGDIADLALTFSITDTALGGQKEIELLPGGGNIDVTATNKHRYINLTAKYYLHDRVKRQAGAFFSGLYQVISPELLGLFCAPELQILISGSQSGLSISDLKHHTRYAGGYLSVDRHMSRFWTIVEKELSEEDQGLLLKFVTACERPPSLGFVGLQPPFTIQKVDCNDDQRLPTASTCFNILKLPTYSSQKVLKEKLLQAIRSRSGFDLS